MRAILPLLLVLAGSVGCRGEDPDSNPKTEPAKPPAPGELVASDLERDTDPEVSPASLAQLTADNRAFAVDLYHQVANGTDNVFFSPHSVSVALAMTYAGANGNTEAEMAEALHFGLPEPELHQAFNRLDLELATREQLPEDREGDGFRLSIVNQTFGQVGFPFEEPFLDTLAVNYGAGMRLLDFESDPEGSRVLINDWVEEWTEDRIEDLLPEGSIDAMTRLVLANAIYFKASWSLPFDEAATSSQDFHRLDGSTVSAPTMHGTLEGSYAEGDGWVMVELPYVGEQVTMGLLVPDAGRFAEIEGRVDASFLDAGLGELSPAEVTLSLPKFSFENRFDLVPPMQALGMVDAFAFADLSGMSTAADLVITGIFHQSFVDVNEEGTEAAAATAVVVGEVSAPPMATVDVDRPFLFWIRDVPTGAVLFLGRVTDPTAG